MYSGWSRKELEVANILAEMGNALLLPDEPDGNNANASETQQRVSIVLGEKNKPRIRLFFSIPQPQPQPQPQNTPAPPAVSRPPRRRCSRRCTNEGAQHGQN